MFRPNLSGIILICLLAKIDGLMLGEVDEKEALIMHDVSGTCLGMVWESK